jgi:hypothetical protein
VRTTFYFTCTRHKIQLTGNPFFTVAAEVDGEKVWEIDLSEMDCPLYVPAPATIPELLESTTEPEECQDDWAIMTVTLSHEHSEGGAFGDPQRDEPDVPSS